MMPAVETVLTMAPPCSSMPGSTARHMRKVPVRLTAMILSQPLSDCSGVWAKPPMPAMLHRLVMGPSSSRGPGHGAGDRVLVGDVAAQRDGPPAGPGRLRVDLGRHGLDGVRGHVEAGHRGALGGQAARRGPPDARARPR